MHLEYLLNHISFLGGTTVLFLVPIPHQGQVIVADSEGKQTLRKAIIRIKKKGGGGHMAWGVGGAGW